MKNRYMVLCDCEASPGWRRWVWFNVDLAVRPAWVIQVVTDDIKSARIANVMDRPAPTCVLMEFCDGYARYGLRYWLDDPALDDPTDSEVRRHVLAALQRQGIRLAVTDHTVHLVKEGQSHRKEVRSRELTRRLDALAGSEIFQCLEDEERVDLAQRLVYAPRAATSSPARALWRTGCTSSSPARPRRGGNRRRAPAAAREARPGQRLRRTGPDDRCAASGHRHRHHRCRGLSARQGELAISFVRGRNWRRSCRPCWSGVWRVCVSSRPVTKATGRDMPSSVDHPSTLR